jgi:hypothetical protein
MSPQDRLSTIIWTLRLRAFVPFNGGWPTISFIEPDSMGQHLLHSLNTRYAPWGIVVTRQWVAGQGGAPAWYARQAALDHLNALATIERERDLGAPSSTALRSWISRFEPPNSDWLHEQEWRIPVAPNNPPGNEGLQLGAAQPIVAVLVGDRSWQPLRPSFDGTRQELPLSWATTRRWMIENGRIEELGTPLEMGLVTQAPAPTA